MKKHPLLRRAVSNFASAMGLPVSVVLALYTEYNPATKQAVECFRKSEPKPLSTAEVFSVLSWNLQYCASRKHHFFYDGGTKVHVPLADVESTLQTVKQVLQTESPAISLLQEIDRNSKRTHHIDQLREIIDKKQSVSWASTAYHRSSFVPFPYRVPLGRIDMNLGIISRYFIEQASRFRLSLLQESKLRQTFNLKRAILAGTIPIIDKPYPLHVGVTHLSAFSYGDGTLDKQVQEIIDWIESRPGGHPWIIGGDFNLLPPDDNPSRLGEEAKYYNDQSNPIRKLIPKYRTIISSQTDPQNRTYLPFGAKRPDRKIDYVFYGGPLQIISSRVLSEYTNISDHLPLKATFKLAT